MHDAFKLYEEQLRLDFDLESKLALAATPTAHREIRAAFAQYRASKLKGRTMADIASTSFALKPTAKAAPAPALEDDNQTATPPPPADNVGDIVKQLEKCLEMLKGLHPDLNADDADADEAQARACLARGDKGGALRGYDAAITKWGARIAAKNASSGLRSQPSSRKRATALIRQGFDSQPGVMALNASFGRAPRADFPAPVAAVPPAPPVVTTTSTAQDAARIKSIEAEIKNIDAEYRKTGVYSPDAQARHATLSRQLSAAKKKFHVS